MQTPSLSFLFADLDQLSALLGRDKNSLSRWINNARLGGTFPVPTHTKGRREWFQVPAARNWHAALTRDCGLPAPGLAA